MKYLTAIFILLLIACSSFGQQTETNNQKPLKNSINLNVGTLYVIYGVTFAANYERSLIVAKNGNIFGAGVSIEGVLTLDAYPIYGKFFGLFGKKNKKFEIAISAGTMLGNPDFGGFTVSPLIGYRKYSSVNGSYFRMGIGFTEGIFIGGGIRF